MTTVVIELERGLVANYLHHYEVIIDGEAYGRLSAGESFAVQLAPGEHAVKFRTPLLESRVLKVFVGYSRTRIIGRANMWRAMGLFELFAPETWVRIREEAEAAPGMMVAEIPERRKASRSPKPASVAALLPKAPARLHPHFARPEGVRLHAL
jgi:hypothetical protein